MIYSSYEFILFLPAFLLLFYTLQSRRSQNVLLLFASAGFISWTGLINLAVVATVVVMTGAYLAAGGPQRFGRVARAAVVALLILNLAFFKYRGFLAETFGLSGVPLAFLTVVPLGISFYTFEAIGAMVDLRRRKQAVTPMSWSLFMMFFPHLIAGPIVRLRQLVPQFGARKEFAWRNIAIGLHLFTVGFLKKWAADAIGRIIDPAWAAPGQATAPVLLLALLGFYVQVYADFSGYTDMGRGVARMMSYRLPINFRAPFYASSPSDLFQRWHISFSSWIRVFVYDVLAVAVLRRVKNRRLQNVALAVVILFVMALFGLWHGAAWHFVVFGIWLGILIVGWTAATKGRRPKTLANWVAGVVLLQLGWLIGLVLFRCDSLAAVGQFLTSLLKFHRGVGYADLQWCLLATAGAFLVQAVDYNVVRRPVARCLAWLRGSPRGFLLMGIVFAACLSLKISIDQGSASGSANPSAAAFIYFRF
jgi:D-alanyl-lipoteichoic acid acyltransferase DltB (MBOAT superfamily)